MHSGGNGSLMVVLGIGDARTRGMRMYRGSDAQPMKIFHTLGFSFLLVLSLLNSPLPVYNFPQVFPFYQLITINHDFYLRLAQI